MSALPTRPRMLFLCQTLPYPPDGGVNIRTYNVLRVLAGAFDITALFFYRRRDRPTPADVRRGLEGLSEFGHVEAFPIPQELHRLRFVRDHIQSLVTGRVYTRSAYESRSYRNRLRELLVEHDFDIVHVDSLDLAAYLPLVREKPTVCVHHNVESDLLRRRAAVENSGIVSLYLSLQARLMAAEERRWCGRVSLNVVVSPRDRDVLSRRIPEGRFAIVPNGVDTSYFRPPAVLDGGKILFVGGTNWYPNRDALDFFCEDILPLLRGSGISNEVKWIGRATPELKDAVRRQHNVELTGYVTDVRPHIANAACYVVPLRIGGGTRLKVLDAWAMGRAVISTSVGCEGLDARDGENILIRDDPAGFAEAVRAVVLDPALRERLGRGARATAEALYSWDRIGTSMLPLYAALAAPPGVRKPEDG